MESFKLNCMIIAVNGFRNWELDFFLLNKLVTNPFQGFNVVVANFFA